MKLTGLNVGTSQFTGVTEMDTNEFTLFCLSNKIKKILNKCYHHHLLNNKTYETGRVVVTGCLGVTKGLKNRVSLHNLIFQVTLRRLTRFAND
jgi:hypothetical protein